LIFSDFNLDTGLIQGLDAMGFSKPTPVQEQAIPVILQGRDLIACAQTGTGKTAAYILPTLHNLVNADHRHLNTLILAPTRELAQQIDQQIEGLAYFVNASSIAVYGGGDGAEWSRQKRALEEGADIIIATPGRLIALLAGETVKTDHLQHLVLDEADRMLDMGFYDDIMKIISYLPAKRQTLMFSATMPPKIRELARRVLKDPVEVSIAIAKPAEGIRQLSYAVYEPQKVDLVRLVLSEGNYSSVIIFASTKEKVKKLDSALRRRGMHVKALHSDLEQQERDAVLREFKNGQLPILVGTDVVSRGIDVEGIDLVINFDVPHDPEDYVHRIGRTARAEKTGTAITLITPEDHYRFVRIEKLIGRDIEKVKVPSQLGEGPTLTSLSERRGGKPSRPGGRRPFRGRPGGGKPGGRQRT
jgi:superfamily II DNA/RNA helicase